jgi:hypothetical protein
MKGYFEKHNIYRDYRANKVDHPFHGIDYLMQFQFKYTHLQYSIKPVHYNNPE